MKYIWLFLVLLIACSSAPLADNTVQEAPSEEENGIQAVPSSATLNEEPTQEESSAAVAALQAVINPADKVIVYPATKKTSIGENTALAIGLTNSGTKDLLVEQVITFKGAKDRTSNTIVVDETTVLSWIKTPHTQRITIPATSNTVEELPIMVGSIIGPNRATQQGVYTFEVVAYTRLDSDTPDVYWKDDFTINVQ